MNNIEIISPATYQFIIFLEAIIIGFSLGFLLDFYRSLRYAIKLSYRVTFFADILFWIIVTTASLFIMLIVLWGEVHLYTYAGLVVGFIIYYLLLSRYIIKFWYKIFGFLAVIINKFLKYLRRLASLRLIARTPYINSSIQKK